jgi:hypothetical protein
MSGKFELGRLKASLADTINQVVLPDMIDISPSSLIKGVFTKLVWFFFTFDTWRGTFFKFGNGADKVM